MFCHFEQTGKAEVVFVDLRRGLCEVSNTTSESYGDHTIILLSMVFLWVACTLRRCRHVCERETASSRSSEKQRMDNCSSVGSVTMRQATLMMSLLRVGSGRAPNPTVLPCLPAGKNASLVDMVNL